MHDLGWILENPIDFDTAMRLRGAEPCSEQIKALDQQRRKALTTLQEAQTRRNQLAKLIPEARTHSETFAALFQEARLLKERLPALERQIEKIQAALETLLSCLPNIPSSNVPHGKDDKDNVILRYWGEKPIFPFLLKPHYVLGEERNLMDFDLAATLSGARFTVLKGGLARLERALSAFMLDIHTKEFGYQEVSPPYLVRPELFYGTGQFPKFKEDAFSTTDGRWLIPTAEVVVTNFVREKILEEKELPLRFVAHTPCFRSEAGAAGRDTRGMIRMHQFSKVELVSITTPDQSDVEFNRMVQAVEAVLQRLMLPYRVVALATGDMGFSAKRTYDLEVWLPGAGEYREISSCSWCGDFQARRMQARYRPVSKASGESRPVFVHTFNGSGLPIGRTLVAIIENYQKEGGAIKVPDALKSYMDGQEII
ncbi:MAG: serine--tRNA ligase [Holosporales bacterium]|jgi:seryl-tRNA synthetase|nr:serine--tRNA ligase [Holosporales bacterium]